METLHSNTSAFTKYRLRPRVLVDVSQCSTKTTIFNSSTPIAFPLGISPAGLQAMAHPDGELATSRAAAKRGITMAISSFSNHGIADVRTAGLSVGPIVHAMQLYSMRDRALQERVVRSAEAAGCKASYPILSDSTLHPIPSTSTRGTINAPP
jgi:(S)-2-hydroxy-acid oxidase